MNPVAAGGVVAPDYYAIGKSVAGTIAKVCRPLTREQRTALTGALSVWLDAADQRTAAAQAEADRLRVDAEGPGVDAERREDMSPRGRLRLHAQEDGDMCVMVIEDDGTSAGIEFCNSGGKSPRTLQALRNLSRAMRDDAIHAAKTEQERGE